MKITDFFKKPKNNYVYEPENKKYREKIIEVSKSRILPNIYQYINALETVSSKLTQNRNLLFDNYQHTLMVDNVVSSLINKRLENIGGKTVELYIDGELSEEHSYFFSSPKFRQFLNDILMTKFWGFSVFEFDKSEYKNKVWFDYFKFPNKHINPYGKEILKHQTDHSGVYFGDNNDILFLGDPNDLGLFSKITLLSLYRRLGMFNYSKYSELASENFTTIKARAYGDDENINNVINQINDRTGGGILQVPQGVDIMEENHSSSQQNQLFTDYLDIIKSELAILILGQTMTTQDGSSYSQAFVHQQEQDNKYTSDSQYVLDVLNFEFVDYLTLWFDIDTSNVQFKLSNNRESEVISQIDIYEKLKTLGVQFTDEELRDKFKNIL